MELTAAQLATLVRGEIEGDASVKVSAYSKIEEAKAGSLSFLANPKYTHYVYNTEASVLLVRKDFVAEHPVKATLIRVDDPYAALADLLEMAQKAVPEKMRRGAAVVCVEKRDYSGGCLYRSICLHWRECTNRQKAKIHPQCYVGDNVEIGEGTILYAGVKVYAGCKIGAHCIVHSGAVIGADGFGFAPEGESYKKIEQIGNVVIEDNVEIGANTTIDRATMGSTIIRKGVKLDNLIQIAHNVEIGENTVMAAQSGVAGSAKIRPPQHGRRTSGICRPHQNRRLQPVWSAIGRAFGNRKRPHAIGLSGC